MSRTLKLVNVISSFFNYFSPLRVVLNKDMLLILTKKFQSFLQKVHANTYYCYYYFFRFLMKLNLTCWVFSGCKCSCSKWGSVNFWNMSNSFCYLSFPLTDLCKCYVISFAAQVRDRNTKLCLCAVSWVRYL